MVISFKLSGRGLRFYPPPPPPRPLVAADAALPPTATPKELPQPPPPSLQHPPLEDSMLWFDGGIAARSNISDKNENDRGELDVEPSFSLNLFSDGFSIGEPGKGMLLLMISDELEKRPYGRVSKALFSDIEYGCLPQDILEGIPCKYLNGTVVCEVRDYRSCMSNNIDYSGDDFPKVNRVALRLGTEYVVKDLPYIVDGSWTYQDQLIAEAMIINSLQPRLNLDPTPCLDRLCNSVVKKIDLGLHKGRCARKELDSQQTKDTSLRDTSTNPFHVNAKSKGCNVSEGAAECNVENATLEGVPSGVLNSSLICPSSFHSNSAIATVESDHDDIIHHSSTIRGSFSLRGRNQGAIRSTTAADHSLQIHEQGAQTTISNADCKNGRLRQTSQRKIILPQKWKEPLSFSHERLEQKNCMPPNRTARSRSLNYKDNCKESMGTSIKEGLKLVTQKELHVVVRSDQIMGNKDTIVQQQKLSSMLTTNRPHFSMSKNKPCFEKFPGKVHSSRIRINKGPQASFVDLDNYVVPEPTDSRPSMTTCTASSRKVALALHEDKAITESRHTTKRKVSENSTISLIQKTNLKGKKRKKANIQIEPAFGSTSSEKLAAAGGTNSQIDISPDMESCMLHTVYTAEPDIEKILSEVILTTQRHGLNEKTTEVGGLETSKPLSYCSLPPFQFFPPENAGEFQYMGEESMSYYQSGRTRSPKIRRLIFHRVQYFFRGIVDESRCTLFLIESEAPDDHQVALGMIFGDEHIHIATLPTSYHANKFVAQFISLMERDGYMLVSDSMECSSSLTIGAHCNNIAYNGCSECREQFEDVSQLGCLTGENPQYQLLSPLVAKSVIISENKDMGCTFPKGPSDVHANILLQGSPQHILTEQSLAFSNIKASFLNYSLDEQLCNTRIFQDQGLLFADGAGPRDIDEFRPVELSREVDIDQYFQSRCDIPQCNEGQWHQISSRLNRHVDQFDLTDLGKQSNYPLLHAGGSLLLPVSHMAGSPQISSQTIGSDDSITSAPVELSIPHQYLSQGTC